jgi:hypothetical protein
MARSLFALILIAATVDARAAGNEAPRTSWGDPDLQGIWTNASLTQLERAANVNKLVLTPAEGAAYERIAKERMVHANAPSDPNAGAPTDKNTRAGYNAFWIDPGSTLGVVNGEIRSSWIIDPPDGRIPYTDEGRRKLTEWRMRSRNFDGPEIRMPGERCIVGFGSTSGPPMLNVLYNNNYQIVQAPGYVTILVEMNHDARIVRLGGKHLPENMTPWMGDSIGHWEGNTLAVETTNLNPGQSTNRFYIPPTAKVMERFTRVAPDQILYQFEVEDASAYKQPWRGEMPLTATAGPIYEYACHEGNYALSNVLSGARAEEKKSKEAGVNQ